MLPPARTPGSGGGIDGAHVDEHDGIGHLDVGVDASLENGPTDDHPVKLRIDLPNGRGHREQNRQQRPPGRLPAVLRPGRRRGHRVAARLDPLVVEDADTMGEHDGGACWRASPSLVEFLRDDASGDGGTVSLDAGGGIYLTYHVLARADNDPCMPAGTDGFTSDECGSTGRPWGSS